MQKVLVNKCRSFYHITIEEIHNTIVTSHLPSIWCMIHCSCSVVSAAHLKIITCSRDGSHEKQHRQYKISTAIISVSLVPEPTHEGKDLMNHSACGSAGNL